MLTNKLLNDHNPISSPNAVIESMRLVPQRLHLRKANSTQTTLQKNFDEAAARRKFFTIFLTYLYNLSGNNGRRQPNGNSGKIPNERSH